MNGLPNPPARVLGVSALVLFAIAFAYVEAAVVVYLRAIYTPIRAAVHPGQPAGELFPVLTLDQLRRSGEGQEGRLRIELGREFATLVMLAAAAATYARGVGDWFGRFMIAFGVWDIFFYVWLKVCIDWPASIWQWDILFLLPVLWAGPVLAPVIVSISMIVAGGIILWRERSGVCYRPAWWSWTGMMAGALVMIVAFCRDWRHLSAGGSPRGFPWWLFGLGEVLGAAAFFAGLPRGGGRAGRGSLRALGGCRSDDHAAVGASSGEGRVEAERRPSHE